MKKIILNISGMHCKSCEKLLEDEISAIPNIKKVRASFKKNSLEVSFDEKPDMAGIARIIEKCGYKIGKPEKNREPRRFWQWFLAAVITTAILLLFRYFRDTGIADMINIQKPNLNFEISFLVGLVASVSSCLAVVGGVIIAFAQKYKTENNDFLRGAFIPNMIFHIGRMSTFFILGGLLGLIGGEVNINGNFVSIYTIIISAIMLWLGLNILGIVPSISNFGIFLPKNLTTGWKNLSQSNHKLAPLYLGALSFFLPCGFTQSMQILALASGSFWAGALGLLAFSLGTVPALMAIGVTTSWTKNNKVEILKMTAGMLIAIFSIYTFYAGLALAGDRNNIFSKKETISGQEEKKPAENGNIQTVEMRIISSGFQPSVIKIKKNIPVQWIIYGDSVSGCTNKIIIPSLNIEKSISRGKNIINFTPLNDKEIPFSCWMGMVRGKFIVE